MNHTLSQYKALDAQCLQLLHNRYIRARGFDELIDNVMKYDGMFVVDSSASISLSLLAHLQEIDVPEFLQRAGRPLYVHTVVAGGQSYGSTLAGLQQMAERTTVQNIIVWINEYFGVVESNEKTLCEMTAQGTQKILGAIRLPSGKKEVAVVEQMISRNQTLDEAVRSSRPATKELLENIQQDLFEQLDRVSTELQVREESVA